MKKYGTLSINLDFNHLNKTHFLSDARNPSDAFDGVVLADQVVGSTFDHPHRRLLGQDSPTPLIHGRQKRCSGNLYFRQKLRN